MTKPINTLELIHKTVSLSDFLRSFNVDVIEDKSGVFRGKCPIHDGNNPSSFVMYVREDGGWSWVCHSHDCHEINGNNVIGFVASIKKISIKEAIRLINTRFRLKRDGASDGANNKYTRVRKEKYNSFTPIQPPISVSIDNTAVKKYHNAVSKTNYFKNLNISREIIDRFMLGYNEETNRIFIPIFDRNNIFVGYNTRCVDDRYIDTIDIDGNYIARYKASSGFKKKNFLYGSNLIKEKMHTIILVEGFKNVWYLNSIGIPAVSIFGHALSQQQLFLIKEIAENVIVCFDNDVSESMKNAGQDGAEKTKKILYANKINAISVCPPPNKDIGDAFTDEQMAEWVKSTLENNNE